MSSTKERWGDVVGPMGGGRKGAVGPLVVTRLEFRRVIENAVDKGRVIRVAGVRPSLISQVEFVKNGEVRSVHGRPRSRDSGGGPSLTPPILRVSN